MVKEYCNARTFTDIIQKTPLSQRGFSLKIYKILIQPENIAAKLRIF